MLVCCRMRNHLIFVEHSNQLLDDAFEVFPKPEHDSYEPDRDRVAEVENEGRGTHDRSNLTDL